MTRQEAINILTCGIAEVEWAYPMEYATALDMAIEALEQEPKIGHWICDWEHTDWFDVTYECSCCKRTIIVPYEVKNEVYKDYPYCHCGAKMAESEE